MNKRYKLHTAPLFTHLKILTPYQLIHSQCVSKCTPSFTYSLSRTDHNITTITYGQHKFIYDITSKKALHSGTQNIIKP